MEAQGKEPLILALEDAWSSQMSGETIFMETHELRRSHGKRDPPLPPAPPEAGLEALARPPGPAA